MRISLLFLTVACFFLTACQTSVINRNLTACSEQSPPMSNLEREQLSGPVRQIDETVYLAEPYDDIYDAPAKDQFWHQPGQWSIDDAETSHSQTQKKLSTYDAQGNLVHHEVLDSREHWHDVWSYQAVTPCKQTILYRFTSHEEGPGPGRPEPEVTVYNGTLEYLDRQQFREHWRTNGFASTILFELDAQGRFHRETFTIREGDDDYSGVIEYTIIKEDDQHRPLEQRNAYEDGSIEIIRYRYFNFDFHGNPRRRYMEVRGHFGPGEGPPTQLINRELTVYEYSYFDTPGSEAR